jgi:5'-methylthioadenosine phosphorylase
MKRLGVTRILGVGAVGSLREEIPPGDFVAVDQFIDRTRHRSDTFFERGVVAHVMFGDPICGGLRATLRDAATEAGVTVHDGGTYVCMEGPQFSTRAESEMYRSFGAHVIGMTNLQEAKLAREAEICYATLAMSTDYDCWREGHDDVTVDAILEVMGKNVVHAREAVRIAAPRAAALGACACHTALGTAILTSPDAITDEAHLRLGLLLERPLPGPTHELLLNSVPVRAPRDRGRRCVQLAAARDRRPGRVPRAAARWSRGPGGGLRRNRPGSLRRRTARLVR